MLPQRGNGQPQRVALGSTLGVVAFVFVVIILLGHYQRTRHHNDRNASFARHSSQVVETAICKAQNP
jgi:hypothetical protein